MVNTWFFPISLWWVGCILLIKGCSVDADDWSAPTKNIASKIMANCRKIILEYWMYQKENKICWQIPEVSLIFLKDEDGWWFVSIFGQCRFLSSLVKVLSTSVLELLIFRGRFTLLQHERPKKLHQQSKFQKWELLFCKLYITFDTVAQKFVTKVTFSHS